MQTFLEIALGYPTIIFSFFLVLVILYWITTLLGLFSFDSLDADISDSGDVNISGVSAIFLKLKLNQVPLTFSMTFLILSSWFISYFITLFLFMFSIQEFLPSAIFKYLLGTVILIFSFWLALFPTRFFCLCLRPFFKQKNQSKSKVNLVGQVAIVCTSKVTPSFGEVFYNDGSAGLLLNVICEEGQSFKKDDRVILLSYDKEKDIFLVISEMEFSGK